MGYVKSAPYLCMETKTVTNLSNEAIAQQDVAITHPLYQAEEVRAEYNAGVSEAQAESIWEQLPEEQCSSATSSVDVYL